MTHIPFNVPPCVGCEQEYIGQAIASHRICGDGEFTKLCNAWLRKQTRSAAALLTTSGTSALEMAALLSNIKPGDEVIMPSYTFVSTANAFILRGAKAVFVDIRPDTMNIDETLIEEAITPRTKVIACVHYAGVACDMDTIMDIARRHRLIVVEDAAQAILSTYKGHPLGSIGDFGCLSFHETKNISMGEGGALLVRNSHMAERAEIIREKGTNRSKFFRGEIDKYTWVDIGSSFLPSELNAAYLYGQLEHAEEINASRMFAWEEYSKLLASLEDCGQLELPHIPEACTHNAHMFWIKAKDLDERSRLIAYLKERGIGSVFHYIPLHSSPAGQTMGVFHGKDVYTTSESERLLRLPLWYGITGEQVEEVCEAIMRFYA